MITGNNTVATNVNVITIVYCYATHLLSTIANDGGCYKCTCRFIVGGQIISIIIIKVIVVGKEPIKSSRRYAATTVITFIVNLRKNRKSAWHGPQ